MKQVLSALSLLAALFAGPPGDAMADIEWEVLNSLALDEAPVDLAVSPDGQRAFVLTRTGEVLIYSGSGKLEGRMQLKDKADRIAVSPKGDLLFLTSSSGKTLQIASVQYVQDIEVGGSPFMGPPDAPVVVAVFSDFQ